jgi:hypothetical protein
MQEDQRQTRLKQYLGHLQKTTADGRIDPNCEFAKVSKFMGQGAPGAFQKLHDLGPRTEAPFKRDSLKAFLAYASVIAGTSEDVPDKVWSLRKQLLEKALQLNLGQP